MPKIHAQQRKHFFREDKSVRSLMKMRSITDLCSTMCLFTCSVNCLHITRYKKKRKYKHLMLSANLPNILLHACQVSLLKEKNSIFSKVCEQIKISLQLV